MVRIFLLLLLASSAWGQAFQLLNFPQTGVAAPFSPTSIANMALYWDYRDLSDGAVASWPDRIQGVAMAQGNAAKRPSKSSAGVTFTLATDGNLQCAVQEGVTWSNVTIWLVFKATTISVAW